MSAAARVASTRHVGTDFLAAAMKVLEESGFPALTAAGLCSRMGVTRGSFYHHFSSFDDFVEQLLSYWEARYSRDLIARSRSDDLATQIRLQAEFAVALPHRAEAALRAWGTVNPHVAAAQRRVDDIRRRGLVRSLRRHGVSPRRADLYATIALATLVGLQVSQRRVDTRTIRQVYDELAKALAADVLAP